MTPELQQNQTAYAFIDEGSPSESIGSSLVGRGNSGSNVAVTEQVIVPRGTVTFPEGGGSTLTTIGISFTMSVAPAEEDAHLVFPGESEIGFDLSTVVFVDEAWISSFSFVRLGAGIFHLVANPDALLLSSVGYHPPRNKFERFRGFWELFIRFEIDFRRCGNYFFFERFEFLVCSKFNHTQCCRTCACAVACLYPHNSISNVVASVTIHDDTYL